MLPKGLIKTELRIFMQEKQYFLNSLSPDCIYDILVSFKPHYKCYTRMALIKLIKQIQIENELLTLINK